MQEVRISFKFTLAGVSYAGDGKITKWEQQLWNCCSDPTAAKARAGTQKLKWLGGKKKNVTFEEG